MVSDFAPATARTYFTRELASRGHAAGSLQGSSAQRDGGAPEKLTDEDWAQVYEVRAPIARDNHGQPPATPCASALLPHGGCALAARALLHEASYAAGAVPTRLLQPSLLPACRCVAAARAP